MDHEGRIVDGRYRLLRRAGRGGMAVVWRAEAVAECDARRAVAVKRILPALARDPAAHAMFDDEARVASAIDHPNVVRFEHYGRDAVGPYLAMEWIEGATLRELCDGHPAGLPERAAVAVGCDVLAALSAAHGLRTAGPGGRSRRAPVIHRDVSPANVLVCASGAAKLADFGLARSLDRPRTSAPGTRPGKLAYLPPEVLAGGPHGVRGDLYAVGAALWESLAGRALFAGIAPGPDLARGLLSAPRPALASARRAVSPALAAAVDRALSLDPRGRYESAAEMAGALLAAIGDPGPGVRAASAREAVRSALRVSRGEVLRPRGELRA